MKRVLDAWRNVLAEFITCVSCSSLSPCIFLFPFLSFSPFDISRLNFTFSFVSYRLLSFSLYTSNTFRVSYKSQLILMVKFFTFHVFVLRETLHDCCSDIFVPVSKNPFSFYRLFRGLVSGRGKWTNRCSNLRFVKNARLRLWVYNPGKRTIVFSQRLASL